MKTKKFYKQFWKLIKKKEMLILPGNLAYFFVLSLVPMITLIFSIASSFNLSTEVITTFIESNFSSDVLNLIVPMLNNSNFTINSIIITVMMWYIASNGAHSIIIASNTVFNITISSFFRRRLKALFLTLLMIVLFAFILVVPLLGSTIIRLLAQIGIDSGFIAFLKNAYYLLNVPLSIVIVFFFIKMIYTLAPDESIKSKYVNKGALFTTAGWLIATFVYSYWINNYARYNLYYGGLTSIVILMLWFYLLAYIFVIGLNLNYRNVEEQIEKTNTLRLNEIKEKVNEELNKKGKVKTYK